jgi:flagellar motor protein MotB
MWLMGAGIVLAGLMLGGCSDSLKEENALLTEENEGLRAQLSERNAALDSAHDELRSKDQRLADLRRQLENAEQQVSQTPDDPFRGIAGVTGSVGIGEVTATLESDILFDSGRATLKSSAKRALDEVARVIVREYPGRTIRVAGHTDTDPIRKSGYKSNYHLGFERAYAVRDYLIQRGVPERNVYIASHGPNRTLGSKQQSRRVEIVVVVNED